MSAQHSPERRAELERLVSVGAAAEQRLAQLNAMRDRAAEVAREDFEFSFTRFEVARQALRDYDRESEQLIAENDGRVASLTARLALEPRETAKNDPQFIEGLVDELREAEHTQRHLRNERLAARAPLSLMCRRRANAAAVAGVRAVQLNAALAMELAQQAREGHSAKALLLDPPGSIRLVPNGACESTTHGH